MTVLANGGWGVGGRISNSKAIVFFTDICSMAIEGMQKLNNTYAYLG
jgi:hypothetical protein